MKEQTLPKSTTNDNTSQKEIDWSKFQGMWDAKRLIDTLCSYYAIFGPFDIKYIYEYNLELEDERPLKKIWRKQINSVFSAYTPHVNDLHLLDNCAWMLVSEQCSEKNLNEVLSILKEHIRVELHPLLNMDFIRKHSARIDIFEKIIEYLVSITKQKRFWRGVMECSIGYACGIRLTEKLFNDSITDMETLLKRCLLLLMGDTSNKTFTEAELIKKYNYPAITDDELWKIDLEWH